MRMLYDKPTASVDLTSSCVFEWIWRCLSPRPRLPTWPSLRVSPFCCNAKLYEAKSTSISHAFLLCWGRDCTHLSFDEQGLGCVILAFLGLELSPAVNQSKVEMYKNTCAAYHLPWVTAANWIFLYYHKQDYFMGCCTCNIQFPQAQLIFTVYLFEFVCCVLVMQHVTVCQLHIIYMLFPKTTVGALVSEELQLLKSFPYLCLFSACAIKHLDLDEFTYIICYI